MDFTILWIEGHRSVNSSFVPGLRNKGYQIEMVSTGKEAITRLPEIKPDLVILNSASMRSTGSRICRSIRQQAESLPILVILDQDQTVPDDLAADVVLNLPFTTRKLVNRIRPLLPTETENTLQAGAIRLDVENKQVYCEDRQSTLTPRLAHLLKVLMEHPGEALKRGRLFREVWNTEYTGDTRTLDVHISWLRQAIEENPRKPKYLKTIRRVGYRLDV